MARRSRIRQPPRTDDGELSRWLQDVANVLNQQVAPMSIFSTVDGPEQSGETGTRGTLGIEAGSSATTTLWVKTSGGTTGWQAVV